MSEMLTTEMWKYSTNKEYLKNTERACFFPTNIRKTCLLNLRVIAIAAKDVLQGILAEKYWICCSQELYSAYD